MRIALKIAYNGQSFHGFARQPNVKTIEGSLIKIFKKHNFFSNPKNAIFHMASRTDKGVSCLGNVIAFNTNKKIENLVDNCNRDLENIVIYASRIVDTEFYARYAKQRIYRYYLRRQNQDLKILSSCALIFKGTHNFSNFARIEPMKKPIRTIDEITTKKTIDFIEIDFYAQTFLWHQIRRIISAIIKTDKKQVSQENLIYALDHPEKRIDFGLACSKPLVLIDITYDFSFQIDPEGLKRKNELKKQLINEIKYLS
jgi:tRNA pseudouridine38-40 synthase